METDSQTILTIFTQVVKTGRYGTNPHGDADGAVHVAFVQPAMFGHAPLLRSQGSRVLQWGSGRSTGEKEVKQTEARRNSHSHTLTLSLQSTKAWRDEQKRAAMCRQAHC